jgi:probable aminopeptidase NPEPL1
VKKIIYAKDVKALLTGSEKLLVVAPKSTCSRFPDILGAKLSGLLSDLAKKLKPGLRGATASTLTGDKPPRLVLGVLPDKVSRYNCPARPECVHHVTKTAGFSDERKGAVLLVLEDPDHLIPALNATVRAFPLLSVKSKDSKPATIQVLAVDNSGKVIPIDKTAKATVEAAREVARLVDTPPTDMNPEKLVSEARGLLRGVSNLTTKVIAGNDLLKAKLGGIHAVGRCALKAPRMLVMTCTPPRPKGKHIALVGKGITYDTGGLHIKGRGMMETMKSDMGGSAAVLGAFRTLVSSGCKQKLSLVLCLAENAIGPSSYKPDDVLTMHSGKTVEINNTDAEGRLVLADGVSYAARVLKADVILDAATLTGAQLIATGNNHAAIFSNSAELEAVVVQAGLRSGDLVHPLPFAPEFYKREFRSPIADMRNSVKNRANAQSSCAAQFIYWHIEDTKVDWCHVDLAGPAFLSDRGTGFGTALLAETVRQLA